MDHHYTAEELLLDDSFIDYCLNDHSPHAGKWRQIIEKNPSQQKTIEEARSTLLLIDPKLSSGEINEEINKLKQVLNRDNITEQENGLEMESFDPRGQRTASKKIKRFALWGAVAASLVLSVTFFNRTEQETPQEIAVNYTTSAGERKKITLPDRSVVILNSNSNLSYAKDFNQKNRKINLSGKAFFEVAKDPTKPFTVYSNNFSTTAIGTAFYVHADDVSTSYTVDLLEGKVQLTDGNKEALLTSGEQGLWSGQNNRFDKKTFDSVYLKQWSSGKILFLKTPLSEAFLVLGNWFDIKISDERKDRKDIPVNGSYENQPLDDILKVICFSASCKYKYEGNKVVIQ